MGHEPFTFYKVNGIYYFRFRDRQGKRLPARSSGLTEQTRAIKWAEQQRESGAIDNIKTDKLPKLKDFCRDFFKWEICPWIARRHAQGHSFTRPVARDRRSNLDQYILPKFGERRLDQIEPGDISDWLLTLKLANHTINQILYSLRIVFDEAIYRKYLIYNPGRNTDQFANIFKRRATFFPEEEKKLFPENSDELHKIWKNQKYSTLYYTIRKTGLRSGEARALIWINIHIEERIIEVLRAIKNDGSIKLPKGNHTRAVPIQDDRLLGMLIDWKKSTNHNSVNDFVFCGSGKTGQVPMSKDAVWKNFTLGMSRAKIEKGDRKLDVHSLRHCFFSEKKDRIPEQLLMYIMGHKSARIGDQYDQRSPLQTLKALTEK